MPRLPRFDAPGFAHHVLQRGHNHESVFLEEDDYWYFLGCLGRAMDINGVELHAYVLMPDHLHLLVTPPQRRSLSRAMQSLGTKYVRYVNAKYDRTGTLWEGRYRSTVLDDYDYVLTCYQYIELNPVRTGLVAEPDEWLHSSYRHHAHGESNVLIRDHASYMRLGRTPIERRCAYRQAVATPIPTHMVERLRTGTNFGWAVGGAAFKRKVEAVTSRRADPKPRGGRRPGAGRPRKHPRKEAREHGHGGKPPEGND